MASHTLKLLTMAVALGIVPMSSALGATCESLATLDIPYATVTAAQSVSSGSFQPPTGNPITGLPDFCRVALTMAPSNDFKHSRRGLDADVRLVTVGSMVWAEVATPETSTTRG